VKETEVQIPDEPRPDSVTEVAAGSADGPYRNLWVPLILIPAALVIAILLVWVLFSGIAGSEASLEDNLQRIVDGGRNDRDQALFNLARQVSENEKARLAGDDLPWPPEPDFLDRVRSVADQVGADNHQAHLALGVLLATEGDSEGLNILRDVMALSAEDDPDGSLRFVALENLALVGGQEDVPHILEILQGEDEGLRNLAAASLGRIQGDAARKALLGALGDSTLEVRGSAALALSGFDPPDLGAAEVLRDLLDPAVYEAENARDSSKYRRGQLASANRVRALTALARLRIEADRAIFEELKADPDVDVSEAAMLALASWPETP
jgi:hypothetical protein